MGTMYQTSVSSQLFSHKSHHLLRISLHIYSLCNNTTYARDIRTTYVRKMSLGESFRTSYRGSCSLFRTSYRGTTRCLWEKLPRYN